MKKLALQITFVACTIAVGWSLRAYASDVYGCGATLSNATFDCDTTWTNCVNECEQNNQGPSCISSCSYTSEQCTSNAANKYGTCVGQMDQCDNIRNCYYSCGGSWYCSPGNPGCDLSDMYCYYSCQLYKCE